MYFRLMAVMFDSPVTPTSESIPTSLTVLLDLENVGIAVGSCCYLIYIYIYIYKLIYTTLHMYFRFAHCVRFRLEWGGGGT